MQRANPNDEDAPKKWYVTQVTAAQVDETQVAMDLADETTLNPSEAMMPIRQLRKILIRRLLGGEKPIHKKLENAIAAWKHTEDAVVLVEQALDPLCASICHKQSH